MKIKTGLSSFGYFIGLLITFQLFPLTASLMNSPNTVAFTVGAVVLSVVCGVFTLLAILFGKSVARLVKEYLESKKNKL